MYKCATDCSSLVCPLSSTDTTAATSTDASIHVAVADALSRHDRCLHRYRHTWRQPIRCLDTSVGEQSCAHVLRRLQLSRLLSTDNTAAAFTDTDTRGGSRSTVSTLLVFKVAELMELVLAALADAEVERLRLLSVWLSTLFEAHVWRRR